MSMIKYSRACADTINAVSFRVDSRQFSNFKNNKLGEYIDTYIYIYRLQNSTIILTVKFSLRLCTREILW